MLNATLVKRIEITPELLILGVKPDGGVPSFLPGQYVALGLPGSAPRPADFPPEAEPPAPDKIIKRAYSIGSSPAHREYYEFYVAVVREGALTSRLVMLKEGDRLFAAPKVVGTFTAQDVPTDHNLILVSTGTGLAPYISMVRSPELWTPQRRITIIHGVRYPSDLAYREELLDLARTNVRFTYLPIVSRADDSWGGSRGHVQRFFLENEVTLNPSVDHVFLCGNPAMIEACQQLLEERGFIEHSRKRPGNLHLEKYW